MRKQYDDFTQLKLKDMSKSISDMTYKYINPETQVPTVVPPGHYEKILDQVKEDEKLGVSFREEVPKKIFEPYEIFNFKEESCTLEKGEGRIVKEAIVPYPPGIPIISPGEILTKNIIEDIKGYLKFGCTILGVNNNKIKVIDNNKK